MLKLLNQLLNLLITMLKLLMLNPLLLKLLIVGSAEAVQSVDLVSTIKAVDYEYSLFCVSVGSPE